MNLLALIIILATCIYSAYVIMWTRAWCAEPDAESVADSGRGMGLSVVIALHDEEDNVLNLLRSIAQQSVRPDEVIMVCDHCTDNTKDTICEFAEREGLLFVNVVENDGEQGKKVAQRVGVAMAHNEYVAVTDADCTLPPHWVRSVAAAIAASPDLIIAPVKMVANDNRITQCLMELEFLSLQMVTAGCALRYRPTMCNGANLIFKRSVYLSHDSHSHYVSGDDMFLLSEIKRRCGSIMYLKNADAIVKTTCPPSVAAYYKQRTRWLRKSTGYTDMDVKLLSVIVFFGNASWPVALLCGACWSAVLCFVVKTLAEALMICKAGGFWGVKHNLWSVVLLAVVYPFVLLSIAVATMVRSRRKW